MKRTQSSVADELNIRAVAALDGAREIPLGDERTKAMHKARILRNAAEMHAHFCGKAGLPADWKAVRRPLPPKSTVRAS